MLQTLCEQEAECRSVIRLELFLNKFQLNRGWTLCILVDLNMVLVLVLVLQAMNKNCGVRGAVSTDTCRQSFVKDPQG